MNEGGDWDRHLYGVGWPEGDGNKAGNTSFTAPWGGKDPRSVPFLGIGLAGDTVRCELEGETLVCRLTRKYYFVTGLPLMLFGPAITAAGIDKLHEIWTGQTEPSWMRLLLTLGSVVFGMALCVGWIIHLCCNATIRFNFGEGVVEFRKTGLFPGRWRFRLQDVSGVCVERRIHVEIYQSDADGKRILDIILLTEAEYADGVAAEYAKRKDANYRVWGKIYWLMLTFADGRAVKAFETSRMEVAYFAAQCIAERVGLPSPHAADSPSGEPPAGKDVRHLVRPGISRSDSIEKRQEGFWRLKKKWAMKGIRRLVRPSISRFDSIQKHREAFMASGEVKAFAGKKIAAGICGILLGGLGIHKFILGLTTPGIIMLLVTVLTCGIGGAVMGPIGLIEGILYLLKSDEEFYQRYAVEKKGWF